DAEAADGIRRLFLPVIRRSLGSKLLRERSSLHRAAWKHTPPDASPLGESMGEILPGKVRRVSGRDTPPPEFFRDPERAPTRRNTRQDRNCRRQTARTLRLRRQTWHLPHPSIVQRATPPHTAW